MIGDPPCPEAAWPVWGAALPSHALFLVLLFQARKDYGNTTSTWQPFTYLCSWTFSSEVPSIERPMTDSRPFSLLVFFLQRLVSLLASFQNRAEHSRGSLTCSLLETMLLFMQPEITFHFWLLHHTTNFQSIDTLRFFLDKLLSNHATAILYLWCWFLEFQNKTTSILFFFLSCNCWTPQNFEEKNDLWKNKVSVCFLVLV